MKRLYDLINDEYVQRGSVVRRVAEDVGVETSVISGILSQSSFPKTGIAADKLAKFLNLDRSDYVRIANFSRVMRDIYKWNIANEVFEELRDKRLEQ